MREHCHRCRKPAAVCICSDVQRVANRTEVVILQHPKEREHPFGTARFAELGLERVRTLVHYGLGRAASPLPALPEGTALIYPSPDAPLLSASVRPSALLFLDGTWAQSRTLHRINPQLAALPCFRIEPRAASRYKIRSEPQEHCTSTIEAIAEALAIVEPELAGLDRLVAAFESMIARQLAYRSEPRPRRKKLRPKPASHAIPDVLTSGRRIVLAHCEISRGELVHLAAIDLDGAVFVQAVKPQRPAEAWWLERAGLIATEIDGGAPLDEVRTRWRSFVHEEDVLVAWNRSTLESIATFVGHPTQRAALKVAYCNLRSAPSGTLEEVIRRERLELVPTPFTGRTGEVLAALIPVARWLLGR